MLYFISVSEQNGDGLFKFIQYNQQVSSQKWMFAK